MDRANSAFGLGIGLTGHRSKTRIDDDADLGEGSSEMRSSDEMKSGTGSRPERTESSAQSSSSSSFLVARTGFSFSFSDVFCCCSEVEGDMESAISVVELDSAEDWVLIGGSEALRWEDADELEAEAECCWLARFENSALGLVVRKPAPPQAVFDVFCGSSALTALRDSSDSTGRSVAHLAPVAAIPPDATRAVGVDRLSEGWAPACKAGSRSMQRRCIFELSSATNPPGDFSEHKTVT